MALKVFSLCNRQRKTPCTTPVETRPFSHMSCFLHAGRNRYKPVYATIPVGDGPGWWEEGPMPDNFKHVVGVQELVDELATHQKELVVVDFFAPWCGACRSLFPKLKKLAVENPDVRFLGVNFEENKQLAKGLGVKVLPYFHFYRGSDGRVAEFSASLSKIQKLRDALKEHDCKGECPFDPDEGYTSLDEFPDVVPQKAELSR